MPTSFDLLYVALFAVGFPLYDALFGWAAYARRVQSDPARARAWLWSTSMVQAWCLVAVGAGYWLYAGRPWSALKFTMPEGWRLAVAIALVVGVFGLPALFHRATPARPRVARIRSPASRRGGGRRAAHALPKYRSSPPSRSPPASAKSSSIAATSCGRWRPGSGGGARRRCRRCASHSGTPTRGGWVSCARGSSVPSTRSPCGCSIRLWPAIVLHVLVDVFGGIMAWLVLRDGPRHRRPHCTTGARLRRTPIRGERHASVPVRAVARNAVRVPGLRVGAHAPRVPRERQPPRRLARRRAHDPDPHARGRLPRVDQARRQQPAHQGAAVAWRAGLDARAVRGVRQFPAGRWRGVLLLRPARLLLQRSARRSEAAQHRSLRRRSGAGARRRSAWTRTTSTCSGIRGAACSRSSTRSSTRTI